MNDQGGSVVAPYDFSRVGRSRKKKDIEDVAGSSAAAELRAISEAISFKSRSTLIKHRAIAQRIDAWAKKKRELGENLGEDVLDKKVALVSRLLGSR